MGCKSSRDNPDDIAARRTADYVRNQGARWDGSNPGSAPGTPHSSYRGARSPHSVGPQSAGFSGSRSGLSSVGHTAYSANGRPSVVDRPFEERYMESQTILKSVKDKIPVICQNQVGAKLPTLQCPKLLVPGSSDVGHLLVVVRERMALPDSQFLYIATHNGKMPDLRQKMSQLYMDQRSDDGFLYLWCSHKKHQSVWGKMLA